MTHTGDGASGEVTRLLRSLQSEGQGSSEALFELVYPELRAIAGARRKHWSGNLTMNTTALIHEAYLKLAAPNAQSWANRAHFFAVASRAMRQILVNYARDARAAKRGDGKDALDLDDIAVADREQALDELLDLNAALEKLAARDERKARVVECRFFAGLEVDETAEALGISPMTVKRDWRAASSWLHRELSRDATPGSSS